ncbi:hypothetical protein ACWT_3484 [Actinoplanes sp. SE50]|uniref:hypothetical protein n=1 Tax=unclassified Actinoplanes TaxID=2626549 RepID=UPI00023EBB9A|nr:MULTISPECIES: hypothetical protein [unclassified Actinoplanes]AEV84507.1 hypothetical protein ACPL_3612 [Actinoplanes sp. SE50/110]ATO82899.1 hypothetical protein ACWT_3484 [Actinoplanes sp. SE50]SLM00307.1 hypothetical protein ACSP50_3539 [Actinoplanes sp. SE50/110]
MLTASKTSVWRGRYQIDADGRPVAVWDPSWWRNGGAFEIDGQRFEVRANGWGTKYRMYDAAGNEVALVERAGRKYWSVQADGRMYEFRRSSFFGNRQELVVGGEPAGEVRRTGAWSGNIEADLPGLPLPLQIFVVGVQIAIWQAQQASSS